MRPKASPMIIALAVVLGWWIYRNSRERPVTRQPVLASGSLSDTPKQRSADSSDPGMIIAPGRAVDPDMIVDPGRDVDPKMIITPNSPPTPGAAEARG